MNITYLWTAWAPRGRACHAFKTGTPSKMGINIASVYPTSNTSAVSVPRVLIVTKWVGRSINDPISKCRNITLASVSLNCVAVSRDSKTITLTSLRLVQMCLQYKKLIIQIPSEWLTRRNIVKNHTWRKDYVETQQAIDTNLQHQCIQISASFL